MDDCEKTLEIQARCRGPGPAKYLLPGCVGQINHDLRKTRNPAFSFGHRYRSFSASSSPGPKYMVPTGYTEKGKDGSPAFSLYTRTKERNTNNVPGPGLVPTLKPLQTTHAQLILSNVSKCIPHMPYFGS